MLKKAINRLLTRAAQNRDCVFACVYRAATVREPVPKSLFHQPVKWSQALTKIRQLTSENDRYLSGVPKEIPKAAVISVEPKHLFRADPGNSLKALHLDEGVRRILDAV